MGYNQHGQCEGVTLTLKRFLFSESIISSGTSSQILDPKKYGDSILWYTELIWWLVKPLLPHRLYGTILVEKLPEILNISVANAFKFLCIETEFAFSNNCWNVEVLSP